MCFKAELFELFNICRTLVIKNEFSRNPCKVKVYSGVQNEIFFFKKHTTL